MAVRKQKMRSGWQEVGGILLLALCAIGLLSVFSYDPNDIPFLKSPPNDPPSNYIGPMGAWFAYYLFSGFGFCGYLIPLGLAYLGVLCLFKREGLLWPKAVWTVLVFTAISSLLDLKPDLWPVWRAHLNMGTAGGVVGNLLATHIFVSLMGTVGTFILAWALLLVGVVMLFEVRPVALAHQLWEMTLGLYDRVDIWRKNKMDKRSQMEDEEREIAKRRRRLEDAMRAQEPAPISRTLEEEPVVVETKASEPEEIEEPKEEPVLEPLRLTKAVKQKMAAVVADMVKAEEPDEHVMPAGDARFKLPPVDMLDPLPPVRQREIKGDLMASGQILKETLAEFGIEVDVTNVEQGPVVTRYELLPAAGVRLEKISALSNNIALAMKAESIRVQAPIPGKGVVGIEVPNPKTTMVFLREIMESDEWKNSRAALPLVIGKDVGGHVIIGDLADMPHMLIAGATGSGKTVCMNSILAGLLMARTPDQMRLMLIDPKIVEFSTYNHLPHLVVPVITDPKKVSLGLRWAINEMEKRYKLFAKAGVRNIKGFNSRPIVKQEELFGGEEAVVPAEEQADKIPDRVPYLVIVVDELADLMLVAQTDIETSIARLAQLSRAVGIHMIIATQRPSVNVITGTIKANFPARISFQVAQKVDSRTILDASGADKLLGKGDMLFLPPGSSKLIRAQGTMTTDGEIHRIVDFMKTQGQPQYETSIKEKIEGKSVDLPEMEEDDELLEAALEIIRQTKRASTSSLQRRLRIGYTRAARVMDLLEHKGIVGPAQGSDPREILMDLDGEVPHNEVKELE